ncbi:hypothetical protein ASPWEDRAFT_172021 [Aspergillus wentii DTO 134E9]|uniref:Mitochondrial K+-H+ exchange-related-domain-containing protein n=1 Tax=Aspergillus wentii DTO 134E9 TaxID=1073089 RepID=A0A1L9RJW6_ASPWE|nr:uncharacterized protein ASPWEDRAFT_172021 [Aspergillus wentii DTO 134E9]KAI9923823.1 hypothetical protein MW887_008305 [Aspergillus wentii]OJJ35193.1 hypothetical protein ASPWEDRAFT_172021 [Aspergillus wentii DTO 134E9]
MRLFLVPISTKRALIYSRALSRDIPQQLSLLDRITTKAAQTWSRWEEADKGWKKNLVSWGNRVQQRIPFEEWGLKSIPSLQAQQRLDESHGKTKIDVLFPANAIKSDKLRSILQVIATERQDLHRQRMLWSLIAAPVTAPIGLIPLVPNIPFFYLAYRGWSHWRALNGSRHLEFLVKKDLLNPVQFPGLEQLYAKRLSQILDHPDPEKPTPKTADDVEKSDERLLLRMSDAKKLASILDAPELALEAERAIVQIEESLKSKAQSAQENSDIKASKKD